MCLPIPLKAGGLVRERTYIYIMKRWLVVSFCGVCRSGKEASGMRGAGGKHPGEEASGMRGARAGDRLGVPGPAGF